jgi:capsular exopolysaccharide synthesis family protein
MNILKVLQKRQVEQPKNLDPQSQPKVVERSGNVEPSFFKMRDLKTRTLDTVLPLEEDSSTIEQSNNLITSDNVVLDSSVVTPMASPVLPGFVKWNVEAERVEPRLVAITDPHSTYCEEYRSLRTHVLHKSQKQKLQSIVVASINPGEGKSVTALNLSWLLAQTDGVKCLIIDSDLRMPSLADYLGIETDKGLSDILAEKSTLKESIIRLEPAGLHLLPGGEARSDVAELISGPKFKEILREAREMFDYVIIDAPPLGIFTDATVLINHADGALFVVRAKQTNYKDISRVLETLPRERILGGILNESEDVISETSYNYRYYNKGRQYR